MCCYLIGNVRSSDSNTPGALDGGSSKLPVDSDKWQCPLSLFLTVPYRFKKAPMLPVEFKKRPYSCRIQNANADRIA